MKVGLLVHTLCTLLCMKLSEGVFFVDIQIEYSNVVVWTQFYIDVVTFVFNMILLLSSHLSKR